MAPLTPLPPPKAVAEMEEEEATSSKITPRKDAEQEEEVLLPRDEQRSSAKTQSTTSSTGGSGGGSPSSQIYVGLVIGVLGVTVVLLLATIAVMLRRNRQKVFSKRHSPFKSPVLSERGHHAAAR